MMEFYADEHCTLCGNSGVIDSRGVATAAGVVVGRLNFCICPNGQALRQQDPQALDEWIALKRAAHNTAASESLPPAEPPTPA